MLLFISIIAFLLGIIVFQQYVIQDKRKEYAHLQNYAYSVADDYVTLGKLYYSQRQRNMEKAYRRQLRKNYLWSTKYPTQGSRAYTASKLFHPYLSKWRITPGLARRLVKGLLNDARSTPIYQKLP